MINLLEMSQQIIVIPKNSDLVITKIKLQKQSQTIELEVEDKTEFTNYYTVIVDTTDIANGEWEAEYFDAEDTTIGSDLWNVGYNANTDEKQ